MEIQGQSSAQAVPERSTDAHEAPEFSIVSEEPRYKRYLTLYNRKIRFPATEGLSAAVHEYDIVGHPQNSFHFTTVFPFHRRGSRGGEVTLLREYCQGPNRMMWVLPTGGFDPKKHASYLACAQAELSEEGRLSDGEWQALVPEGHAGIAEGKWCANRFTPYLCIDAVVDPAAGERDAEEFIEVHRVGMDQLRAIMISGDMLLPSVTTCFMALERLFSKGYL